MIPQPLPRVANFERLAYGLFLHWGLYSQLGRGEWVMNQESIDAADYAKLREGFTAADFDARAIARLARESGMKYITLTTRHHDGFSLYDTRGLNDFDAPHSPAGRDLVAEFVAACRAEGIVPFFYHTTLDWRLGSHNCTLAEFDKYLEYLNDSVEILCANYGPIGGLWFDGNWSRNDVDWKEDRLYATIRKHQPEAIIVNNTGLGHGGQLGNPQLDSTTFEQGLPSAPNREGLPKYVAGEMCQTMNLHWGIGARDFAYMSPRDIIRNLAACRKVGANYLLNVGPTAGGAIPDYEAASLRRVGDWTRMVGAPLYEGKPTAARCEGRDFVLEAGGELYYFVHDLQIAGDEHVTVGAAPLEPRTISGLGRDIKTATWLDNDREFVVQPGAEPGSAVMAISGYPYGTNTVVRVAKLG